MFGEIVHLVGPATGGSVGAYALVGKGAVFAGAARAPITTVVMLFELTGESTIILPMMLAIVLATGMSYLVSHDIVSTRNLLWRGIDLEEPADAALARTPLSSVMGPVPTPTASATPWGETAVLFAASGELIARGRCVGALPVGC